MYTFYNSFDAEKFRRIIKIRTAIIKNLNWKMIGLSTLVKILGICHVLLSVEILGSNGS